MRKTLALLLIAALLPLFSLAEEAVLGIIPLTDTIRPCRAVLISFSVPEDGTADLYLSDSDGQILSVVVWAHKVKAGLNHVWWNGTYESVPAPEGSWQLTLRQGDRTTSVPVTLGSAAPYLTAISPLGTVLTPESPLTVSFYASCDGTLTAALLSGDSERIPLAEWDISEGDNSVTWTGIGQGDGRYRFEMQLTDPEGDVSEPGSFSVTLSGFDAYYEAQAADEAALAADSDETIVVENPPEDEPSDENPTEDETLTDDETLSDDEALSDDEILSDDETITDVETISDDETLTENEPQPEDGENPATPQIIEEEVLLPDDDETTVVEITRESDNHFVASCGADQAVYTPSYSSPYAGQDQTANYWTTPMNIADEEAVWQILMEPITVLDNGKAKAERTQVAIRKEPDNSSAAVGLVTCITQGVHVLERGDTWSLIECYSSSFYGTTVEAWNLLVQGYVPTKYLKSVTPNQKLGLVVDKMTQRLYIFQNGKLYDTLLVSTGLANSKQPFNETRSGEFLLQDPAVGEFRSDSLYCSMGIRFNDGDLLHEVPHLKQADGGKTYKTTEYKLGTKASHGCIRVQRRRTPQGVNMTWIWNHRANNIKILIWEDWQGRQLSYPSDDTVVYYNPSKGTMYHSCETCYSAVNKTFVPFSYSELDEEPYSKLTRCEWCNPPLRRGEIDAINQKYAPGGDHDPILTKAQQKFLDKLED